MKKTRHLIKRKMQKARHALLRIRTERPALFVVLAALAFSFGGLVVWGGVTVTLSINSASLESGLVLHYTFDAADVTHVDPSTPSDWYNSSWTHRKLVTIQSSLVEETVTNFPVLIQRTDTNWRSTSNGGNVGQTTGNDILFTSSSGAKLDHEIEYYDPATGELVAWVKVPSVSSTVNTELYIYYGNTSASNQQNPTGVWSNGFQAVYHMAEQSGTTLFDSTLNNNDATKLSATDPTATTGGQIDGAQDFDGTNDNAEAAHKSSLVLTNAMTLSGWINPDALGQSSSSIIIGKDFNGGKQDYALAYKPDGTIRFRRVYDALENTWDMETTGTVPLNTWTYVTGVFDGSQMRVYIDGSQDPTVLNATQNIYNSGRPLILGSAYGASALNRRFDGTLDELRISNVARSAGWVQTEYNNQNSPSTFSVVGTEEARSNYSAITIKEYGEFMGSTTLASPVGEGYSNHGPYVAHNKQWIFFSNGSGGFVHKTKDLQGGIWSEPSSSYSSYIGQSRYFNITFDGTHFHKIYRISGNAIYRRYTPNPDGTVTAGSTHTIYSDATWSVHFSSMYITTDYQGRPWVQFQVTDGINYKPMVVASTATDGTWSTRAGFPYDLHTSSTSTDHGLYPGIVELGDGRMIFTWRDVINNRMSARVWDNGVWGAVESTGLAQGSYGRTSTISPASGEVMINAFTTVAHRAADGTWSLRSPGGMNTASDNSFSKAGDVIRLWDDNGGNDIRYKETSDAGLTWGPLTTFATATDLSTFSSSSEVDAGYHSVVWSTGINPYVRFAGVDGEIMAKNNLEAVSDRSGNANNGVVEGGVTAQAGRIGQAAELNGDDGYISVGNIGANIRSVSFWFKPNVLEGGLIAFNGSQSIAINPGAAVSWYNSSWSHRKPITIQSSRVEETLTNFPVLVQTTDAEWRSTSNGGNVGQTNGNDILFTSSSGAKLDHEIEYYNPTTGELIAWVKVPSVSSSVNTTLYIYYGNSGAANQQNATGVWDNNYAGVWHFKEDPSGTAPQMLDSTSNANAGTSYGSMTSGDQVTGQIDGSLDFDDVDDVIRVPNSTSTNITGDQFTLSAWVYPRNIGCGSSDCDDGIISKAHESASNSERYHLGIDNGGAIDVRRFSGTQNFGPSSGDVVVNNQWQYIVGRYDGATLKSYYNGNEVGSTAATGNITSSTEDLIFGKRYSADRFSNGRIDEPRISNIARSSGWIKTEYNNQSSPSTFYAVGTQEIQSTADILVNGLVSPTVYIDGSTANTTLSLNTWHHITVTTSTNINASAVEIGRVGSSYFDGVIDDVRIYGVTLPGSDIDRIYHLGATTTIGVTLSSTALENGLVLHHSYDGAESAGGTVINKAGASHSGTYSAPTAINAGRIGQGIRFSGVANDMVTVSHDAALTPGAGSFTYGLWVHPEVNVGQWDMPIYKGGASAGDAGYDMELGTQVWGAGVSDGTSNVNVYFNPGGWCCSTYLSPGQWYHLMVVVDRSTNQLRAYVNGVETNTTASIAGLGSIGGTKNLTFGHRAGGSADDIFRGTIDDVRIYNRALSDEEVYRIYDLGATSKVNTTLPAHGSATGPIAHWTMDGKDVTPGAINITATGGTISESGGYTYHTFTSNGTFQVTSGSGNVEVLVVGGGAAGGTGGSAGRGGGGAGGIVHDGAYAVTAGSYAVTVGGGGATASSSVTSGSGGNSVFGTLTALGGGGAGPHATAGTAGGSGGGGSGFLGEAGGAGNQPGSASGGFGNAGGASFNGGVAPGRQGGGGGAGAAGANGVSGSGGNGGVGREYSQFASVGGSPAGWFGGGGGGGASSGTPAGSGGQGGGGAGGSGAVGGSGVANTGGGGGGSTTTGGAGGSGVVIVRYLTVAGGEVRDQSGNAHHGEIVGATIAPGIIGQALEFDGSNNYLEMPNSSALRDTPNNQWAMSAWVYPTETGGNSRVIVRKSTGGDGYYMRMTSAATFQSLLRFSTGFVERIAGTIAVNEWTHVVMTYDGTTRKHYLNGEEVGSWNEGGTLVFDANVVRIGANTSSAELFKGIIDDVRIYNRTLSAEEVQRLYQLGN